MKTFFVSSTFRDMQFERDAISEITLPMLNEVAKKYGQTVSFCDLRWGIDTSDLDKDGSSKKVLNVCFDQIDRSSSPMIVILGERYGYIPSKDIISEAAELRRLQLDDLEKSVTALEIEYGVFSEFAKSGALFYFRNVKNAPQSYLAEDERHAKKLKALKERIVKLTGGKLRTYDVEYADGKLEGVTEFAQMLARDLQSVLIPEWQAEAGLTPFERDRKIQWNYIHDRAATFRGREKLVADVLKRIETDKLVVVKGAAGSGKSELFTKLAVTLAAREYDVLPFVGGLTTESNDSFDIIRNTVIYLENKLGITAAQGGFAGSGDEHKFPEWRARAGELVERYCKSGNKFVIMADAVDRLYSDEYRHTLAFIPEANVDGYCFFATCLDTFKELDSGSIKLENLDLDDRRAVIFGALERYGRELDGRVVSAMLGLPAAGNPQYLGFLIKRLMMMNRDDYDEINASGGTMADITARQLRIVDASPATVDGMCAMLLDEACKRINESLLADVLRLMACSRFGLRESDFHGIIGDGWDVLDFLHFVSYMGDCFILRDDGRYDLSHASIRDGILKNINEREQSARILAYFKTIADDPVASDEICYHAVKADDKEYFREFVGSLYDRYGGDSDDWVMPYLKSMYEFTTDGDGAWIRSAVATAPATRESVGFLKIMQLMGSYCMLTYSALDIGIGICLECQAVAQKLIEANIPEGGELLFNAQASVGSASLMRGDTATAGDVSRRVYESTKGMYESDKTDKSFFVYLQAARLYIVARLVTAYGGADAPDDSVDDAVDPLVEEAERRFDSDPNKTTAFHYYYALLIDCLAAVFDYNCEVSETIAELAVQVISPYLGQYETSKEYTVINEIASSFATTGMRVFQAVMGTVSAGSVDPDAREEIMTELGHLHNVIGKLYGIAKQVSMTAYEKFDNSDWAANLCWTLLNATSVDLLLNDMASAEKKLVEIIGIIDVLGQQEYTMNIRGAAVKAKALLATSLIAQGKNIDYASKLATEMLVDAENIMASDESAIAKNAAVEAYISLLNFYLMQDGVIDFDTAYNVIERFMHHAMTDLLVRDLFTSIESIYCSAIINKMLDDDDVDDEHMIGICRIMRDYARSRVAEGGVLMKDVLYMADSCLVDTLDGDDCADECMQAGAEALDIVAATVDALENGNDPTAAMRVGDLLGDYGDILEQMLDLADGDEQKTAELRAAASKMYFKMYELTGVGVYAELARRYME